MEDHLPEYEHILMVNASAEEVPAINFNGACYELQRNGQLFVSADGQGPFC